MQSVPRKTERSCQTAVQRFKREIKKKFTREKVILNTSIKETGNKASPSRDEQ